MRHASEPQPAFAEQHGPYARLALGEQPVAYWRLGEAGGAGTTVADASGNENHAVCEKDVELGAIGPPSPRFSGSKGDNRCARFAGGRIRGEVRGLGDAYSVELWFWNARPLKQQPVTGYVFSRGWEGSQGSPGDHLGIGGLHSAPGRLFFYNGDDLLQHLTGKTVIPPETWNHLVMVRNRVNVALYLNGNPEPEINGETATDYLDGLETIFIGGRSDNFANFHGRIDEVVVYDRALTPEEIAAHYAESGMWVPPFWQRAWFLILATLGVSVVAGAALRNAAVRKTRAQLARLEQQSALEQERARIARDMHDELGASLASISFVSELAKREVTGVAPAEILIDRIATTARALIRGLDQIVWAVSPANDTLDHLASYLCEYASRFFDGTPTECRLQVPGLLPKLAIDAHERNNMFLACKEALHNVAKHARASEASVALSFEAPLLTITIQDDGAGFDPGTVSHGDGLSNMRSRLKEIGGTCAIESQPGLGTRVTFTLRLGDSSENRVRSSSGPDLLPV